MNCEPGTGWGRTNWREAAERAICATKNALDDSRVQGMVDRRVGVALWAYIFEIDSLPSVVPIAPHTP
jgi:hypothetical protein